MKYKGHKITKTKTTTDVFVLVFGKQKKVNRNLYKIEGPKSKSEGTRPFLTSVKACKEYINQDRS